MLRSLTRDLDRIMRIVHGAARRAEDEELIDAEAPASVFEAYRILGLNPEAPYFAVKKVVDALRMSWHRTMHVTRWTGFFANAALSRSTRPRPPKKSVPPRLGLNEQTALPCQQCRLSGPKYRPVHRPEGH
jgi:hypothetical protein